ncbi:MAG: phosphatase PAP2 family protein [Phaeodactylibacter sp.]|uniref:phosphatase PAP2 family protein n=1 Tax=Phaeodactylibacter sp. TaxID=1940289 RepID=UPI0032EE206B
MEALLENIIHWDESLFHLLNGVWTNPLLDEVMPWWRDKKTWIPLYLILAGVAIYRFRLRGLYFILGVVLTVGVADTVSSKVMKPTFERLRPCNNTELPFEVMQRGGCGRGYSFTSSHATNHLAIAWFIILTLGRIYKWVRWPFLLWALSIAYGQVYVGVHYPLDVIVGGCIGSLIGFGLARAFNAWPALNLQKVIA